MINSIDGSLRVSNSPARFVLVLLLSLLLQGCGGPRTMLSTSPRLTGLEITPQASSIALGLTAQFKATGKFSDGSSMDETKSAMWTSSNGIVASIDTTGFVTSHSMGNATMIATVKGISSSAALTVSKATMASIAVDPSAPSMVLGSATQLKATGTYTDHSTQDVTNTVIWESSEPNIAVVSSAGLVVSRSIGDASITATAGSVNASCKLTVSQAALVSISVGQDRSTVPLGVTAQLTAQGVYTDGSTRDLTSSVSWSSSPLGVVNVNTSGLATGLKIGTATVNARSGTIAGTRTLTVNAAQLTAIAVTTDKATMPLGTAQQITATGTYTDGSTHDLTNSVSWSNSPMGVVNVNTSGLATGLKIGTATVNARSGTIAGTRTLTVSAALLTAIAITTDKATMPLGTAQQITATGTYTDGSSHDLTNSVSWFSESDQIVSVTSSGVAQARALGSTAVSATASAIRGSAALTVSSPALASISISPASPTIPLGSSLQLGAIGSFTDGSTQDLTNSAIWSVVNPSVVNLSSTGNANAQQVGSTSVEATLSSIQGSTMIVIEPIAATSYFTAGPEMIDTTFRFTNPGSDEPNLCAMTYVFDQDQQMAECCGCLISQNGLRTLSLNHDLISNPLTGTAPVTGSVLLVTADYVSNPSCNASSITPDGMAIAWATHVQTPTPSASAISEETLSQTPLSATLSSALQAQCQFIQQLGSGQGICSCGTGH
jgi:hypothetical protein